MDAPRNKATIFNTAMPAANADMLAADIAPELSPGKLRIYICISIAAKIYVSRTAGGVTVAELCNGGADLTAASGYTFYTTWLAGETINIKSDDTGGDVIKMQIDEYWED
jgi:hypothetical protein